ncbi:MAG: rhomboid family intramembrane serine protease [Candidatus Brocadiia bacterium]
MLLFVPYRADVLMPRLPIANFALIGFTTLFYVLNMFDWPSPETLRAMYLDGWKISGLLGHVWVHGGILHVLGNMIFLWTFGNVICAKVGNFRFLLIYLLLGLFAACVHNVAGGRLAIGASGAIYGLVGMFVVWFPKNYIVCLLWFIFVPLAGKIIWVASYWLILLWLAFDIYGTIRGGDNIGHLAHLGGFVGGFVLALYMTKTGLVERGYEERNLIDIYEGRK